MERTPGKKGAAMARQRSRHVALSAIVMLCFTVRGLVGRHPALPELAVCKRCLSLQR